jgi:hypothetical protein
MIRVLFILAICPGIPLACGYVGVRRDDAKKKRRAAEREASIVRRDAEHHRYYGNSDPWSQ